MLQGDKNAFEKFREVTNVRFKDEFEQFLILRQELLWNEIKKVTGVTIVADLESDE